VYVLIIIIIIIIIIIGGKPMTWNVIIPDTFADSHTDAISA